MKGKHADPPSSANTQNTHFCLILLASTWIMKIICPTTPHPHPDGPSEGVLFCLCSPLMRETVQTNFTSFLCSQQLSRRLFQTVSLSPSPSGAPSQLGSHVKLYLLSPFVILTTFTLQFFSAAPPGLLLPRVHLKSHEVSVWSYLKGQLPQVEPVDHQLWPQAVVEKQVESLDPLVPHCRESS